MNPDIGRYRDIKLKQIFNENKNTDRIYNNYTFMKKYPDFDLEYFRNFNESLFSLSSLLLKKTFHLEKNNSYIYNKESFFKKYPDFDIDTYRENIKYRIELNLFNDITLDEKLLFNDEFTTHLFYHREINNLSNKYTFFEIYNKLMEYHNDYKNNFYNFVNNSLLNNSLCDDLSYYTFNVMNLNDIKVIEIFNYNFDFVYPTINNESNKLYELFSTYKKYYDENKIVRPTEYYNLHNQENYFYWIESCIKNKYVSIISPKSGKIISTDKYFIINYEYNCDKYLNSIVNYYFEDEDIVLGLGLGTGTILSTMETRILYIYNHNDMVLHYSYENMCINIFKQKLFSRIIKNMIKINFEKENIDNCKSQVITLYGFHTNLGHNLFNDMTGLYILNEAQTFNYIDKVILGNNDPFFIHSYLKEYDNLEIENTEYINHYDNYFGKGIFFKYNHYFISNSCCDFIKNILKNELLNNTEIISINNIEFINNEVSSNNNIEIINNEVSSNNNTEITNSKKTKTKKLTKKKIEEAKLLEEAKLVKNLKKIDFIRKEVELIKKSNNLIINIVLRVGHSFIENQVDFFVELIDKIYNLYPNAFFYFDGFCSNPYLLDSTPIIHHPREITYKQFIIEFNELCNEIVTKFNNINLDKNIKYKSLINMTSYELIEYLSICNYGIYQIGSSCTISGWLCNIPGYQFGRTNTHLYKYCDDNVRETMPKIIYNSEEKININDIIDDIQQLFS